MRRKYANIAYHSYLQDGAGGAMEHKVTGAAKVDVSFTGMPKGVWATAKSDGIFKEVRLNRGRAGLNASQD